MPYPFAEIAFTDAAKAHQTKAGSRAQYERMEQSTQDRGGQIGTDEKGFIEAATSFYMASVNTDGWPYIQHRGGPKGFVRLIDDNLLGFADFRGNKQYVSLGNFETNNKTSLFFMDYPNKARLKLFANARIEPIGDRQLEAQLVPKHYKAVPERFILLQVQAFDWNCPQHITQRYSMTEIQALANMHAQQ